MRSDRMIRRHTRTSHHTLLWHCIILYYIILHYITGSSKPVLRRIRFRYETSAILQRSGYSLSILLDSECKSESLGNTRSPGTGKSKGFDPSNVPVRLFDVVGVRNTALRHHQSDSYGTRCSRDGTDAGRGSNIFGKRAASLCQTIGYAQIIVLYLYTCSLVSIIEGE